MPKIFISYGRDASYGQDLATEAQQQLQSAGFEVFRDVIGLKPGDVWYSKLEFELENSDLVVLVISEKIRKSEWVYNEISMAKEIGLPIIPIIAEQVRMPLWLRHLQTLDFSSDTNWRDLIEAVNIQIHSGVTQESGGRAEALVSKTKVVTEVEREVLTHEKNLLNPFWACRSGKDQYGQYADLKINKVVQRFRLITPGTFWMGSPLSEAERSDHETHHRVTLTSFFWLADTAVTQALWLEVMGSNPSHFSCDLNNPVESVGWGDSCEFIECLNKNINGLGACLPTEAQWEYACRAGTNTPFYFGNEVTSEQINVDGGLPYSKGEKGLYRKMTLPVKSLPANSWGLYEMHGNVWERCHDTWCGDLGGEAVIDPSETKGDEIVVRGGSWDDFARYARSASRDYYSSKLRHDSIGLRLALKQRSVSSWKF